MASRFDYPSPPEATRHPAGVAWVLVDYNGRPGLEIWVGKARKPARYLFGNEKQRADHITGAIAAAERAEAQKRDRQAMKRAKADENAMDFNPGDILHYSWGYDQTNCEFYVVTRRSGRAVWIREIAQESVPGSEGFMCDKRRPKLAPAADGTLQAVPLDGAAEIKKIIGPNGIKMPHGCATPCSANTVAYRSWYA